MEQIDLNLMPRLKELLTNYILFMYQEDAIITAEYLEMEYYMLKRNNRLHELFDQELLDNSEGGLLARV